jgi:hypothetical protein
MPTIAAATRHATRLVSGQCLPGGDDGISQRR